MRISRLPRPGRTPTDRRMAQERVSPSPGAQDIDV